MPDSFIQILSQANVDFFMPVEAGYKNFKPFNNTLSETQFAIRSKKEKLEIRYLIKPQLENDPISFNPHVLTMRTVASVASNNEEYRITATHLEEREVQSYNADWGVTYFFNPKESFSEKPFCRMTALFKEGYGTAFVFYLFKNPNNEFLNHRLMALQFLDDPKSKLEK